LWSRLIIWIFIFYRCVPDVWGLHEWSNWLTPYVNRYAKRYDTFFYKAALLEYPEYAREDNVETTKLMVETPSHYLNLYKQRKCIMGPPQIVELSRCLHFQRHTDLIKYFVARGLKGMDCCLPVMAFTTDDVQVSLYPGDHWYPKDIDQTSTVTNIRIPVTYESIIANCTTKHPCNHSARISTPNMTSISTNAMPYGLLNPVYFNAADNNDDDCSKLWLVRFYVLVCIFIYSYLFFKLLFPRFLFYYSRFYYLFIICQWWI